jgi:hypothetical protein
MHAQCRPAAILEDNQDGDEADDMAPVLVQNATFELDKHSSQEQVDDTDVVETGHSSKDTNYTAHLQGKTKQRRMERDKTINTRRRMVIWRDDIIMT